MSWYLIVKFVHIIAVAITVGGMFARQLVRAHANKSEDVKLIASLTHLAIRIDRLMVIPWSNVMIVMGIILAIMSKWPVFGFLQGATQNWLLVSNILLFFLMLIIPTVFVPYNKKLESILQPALAEGRVTPELAAILDDRRNKLSHLIEEVFMLTVAALMVLKPF